MPEVTRGGGEGGELLKNKLQQNHVTLYSFPDYRLQTLGHTLCISHTFLTFYHSTSYT